MNLFEDNIVIVNQSRYDELLHKETMLDTVAKLHGRMSDYVFRDAIGFLLKSDAVKGNE